MTSREDTAAEHRHAGPLAGVRVVELAGMGPVPFTAMMLADMGAQVVRIERPASRAGRRLEVTAALDDIRDVVKRSRTAVAVDLKDPSGIEYVLELCAQADVFIEGFRPGVTERLGLGPQTVLSRNERLVYTRITGYGQDGPLAQAAGHDINYAAVSGVLHAIAREGERPLAPLNLLADFAGGGMLAAFGIVSALLESRTSGRGQVIDASMTDGVALLAAKIHALRTMESWRDEPGTNFIDSGAPFYDVHRTLDGKYVAVGALEADFYAALLSRLGVDTSDWPAQQDRASWPKLRKLLADVFALRTRDDWVRRFEGVDACLSPVLTFDEAAAHPHNAARGTYQDVDGVVQPTPAPRFGRTPSPPSTAPQSPADGPGDPLGAWPLRPDTTLPER